MNKKDYIKSKLLDLAKFCTSDINFINDSRYISNPVGSRFTFYTTGVHCSKVILPQVTYKFRLSDKRELINISNTSFSIVDNFRSDRIPNHEIKNYANKLSLPYTDSKELYHININFDDEPNISIGFIDKIVSTEYIFIKVPDLREKRSLFKREQEVQVEINHLVYEPYLLCGEYRLTDIKYEDVLEIYNLYEKTMSDHNPEDKILMKRIKKYLK